MFEKYYFYTVNDLLSFIAYVEHKQKGSIKDFKINEVIMKKIKETPEVSMWKGEYKDTEIFFIVK